jgi:type VI secretion system protein ImpA
MDIDIEALTAPVSEDSPAGPDMSYETSRQEIESAFEKASSNDDDAGEDVDWRQTIASIESEAAQTRDIWLAVYLMRAGAKIGRFDTVEAGAQLLAGLCENLWDSVHPQIDDYGFQGRKGPCESLTRFSEFLKPLRSVVLLEHPRLGTYTGADFERFRLGGDGEDGYGMFRALLAETPEDDLQAVIDRLSGIVESIRRADTVMTANADGDTATNFQPTYEAIDGLRQSVASFMTAPTVEIAESGGGEAASQGSGAKPAPSGPGFSGGINSREDVIKALDAIALYYRTKEPGSPVPFALRRARDWVSLNFLQVLEDIAPNSMDEARRVLVNGRSEGSDGWSSSEGDGWSSGE